MNANYRKLELILIFIVEFALLKKINYPTDGKNDLNFMIICITFKKFIFY